VRNVCEDFYQSVDDGAVPEFDVLVTNPPYTSSAPRRAPGSLFHGTTDHVERLLRYCRSCGKPCALLMPNYVSAVKPPPASLAWRGSAWNRSWKVEDRIADAGGETGQRG
jgi:hypothetical protein